MSEYGYFSGTYFPVLGLNTEIYGVNLRIWTLFHAVIVIAWKTQKYSDNVERNQEVFT